jgi:hypothetical protein
MHPINAVVILNCDVPALIRKEGFAQIVFSNGSTAGAFRVSTLWDACALCALGWRLMG